MGQYLIQGVVLPERATLTLGEGFIVGFDHPVTGYSDTINVRILSNKVTAWLNTENKWEVYDLRNVAKHIVQSYVNVIGYFKGYAYEVDIVRILNIDLKIDMVFGIDIPCLEKRNMDVKTGEMVNIVHSKIRGAEGLYLQRCFNDLISAMKNADDTGFYCYRAIESLRHHCASIHKLSSDTKKVQWQKFREISGSTEQALLTLKDAADPLRHGKPSHITSDDRAKLFISTWDVVDGYLSSL
jgi:hypothetical protein